MGRQLMIRPRQTTEEDVLIDIGEDEAVGSADEAEENDDADNPNTKGEKAYDYTRRHISDHLIQGRGQKGSLVNDQSTHLIIIIMGSWRNGSAFDSRSKGWVFDSP